MRRLISTLLLATVLAIGGLMIVGASPGAAQEFSVPGLEADTGAYLNQLKRSAPAGLTPAQRRGFEQAAADAARRNDWNAVVAALESRLSGGTGTAEQWIALARAQLRRTPPQPARAAQAAWQAFGMAESGGPEVPALLAMAEAFRASERFDVAIRALEAAAERLPDDRAIPRLLREVRQQAGIQVRRVRTEPEGDPPQACIEFTTAPARRADFVPADWVTLSPGTPGAAITREKDQFCIAGLRLGATTRVTIRAGMPGEDGLRVNRDVVLDVAMPNRAPRLVLDGRSFLLPLGQAATVTLTSVNLSRVKLSLYRVSERNVVPWTRDARLGGDEMRYAVGAIGDSSKLVWEGTAELAHWQPNQLVRTALPLPDAFGEAGVYVLQVAPGDGTPEGGASSSQAIIRTNLAPTVWRGADGLTVQVRSFADGAVQPGVLLRLLSRANDVLAEATTDAEGTARFAAPLLRGEGPQAAQDVHAFRNGDFVALDLTTAAFDLSDRGVEGAAHPGPLDAWAWTDRGIYRPGETVQLMALLRDAAGRPADVSAHVVVRRPNGQVFLDATPPRGPDASLHLPVGLSLSAPAGTWTVELLADPKRPPIGRASFRVDAFVPDRMAVELGEAGAIVPGRVLDVPVTARFLYGAPAANLSASATLALEADPDPPQALPGFRVGLEGEVFAPDSVTLTVGDTDAQGRTTVPVALKAAPDTTRLVRARLDVSVDDPSGRSSSASAVLKVRPAGNVLGIRPDFAGGAVDDGGEAAFAVAALNRDGARTALPARLKLVRERPDWRMVRRGGLARYETVYRDEPVEARDVEVPATGELRYAKRLPFGRYRLEVAERDGLAASSVRFRAGWVASDSADTPDKVDVSTDRRSYKAGETARVHVVSPFAGKATLLTLTDRVISLRDIEVAAGGTDVAVPVDAAWGPGAYAAVHVFRGPDGSSGNGSGRPARAIGLAWIGVDPAARTLPLTVEAPAKVTPRGRVAVAVRTAPGAWVTLAAVDEGILRLTRFETPNPAPHFLGRRTLGLDIRDDWGRLIRPGEGEATALRQGGDSGGSALPEIPQKTVTLFTPPVQAGADGVATIPLDLPDFNGQVRLMAVAWQGDRVAGSAADMIVRDPLVAEPLLPRFLAPGDEARLGVLMQNLELPAGEAAAVISVEGPLQVVGEARLAATLPPGASAVRATVLRGTGVGRGIVRLAVTGPGGFTVTRETAILVRPSRPPVSLVAASELAPRQQASLQPPLAGMVPGTASARAVFGGAVRYDPAALLRSLKAYPLACLEQATSKGLPLTAFGDDAVPGPDRARELAAAVSDVLDKQRFDGGFALWSASGEAEAWLSAYATEFLLRAQKAGVSVPEAALRDALKFAADALEPEPEAPEAYAARAYNLYVLALAGRPRAGANRILAEAMDKLPTPLSKAQLGAAFALSNDRPRAESAFAHALAAPNRNDWDADRGSALRDQVAVAMLLKESGLLADRLPRLLAALPGSDLKPDLLSTQEQAWAAAAAAVLGRDGRPVRVNLDGRELSGPVVGAMLTGPATARNLDDRPLWQSVSTSGVPLEAPPAARGGMRVSRRFFTLTGEALNLDELRQNTVFVLLIEGRADDGQDHRAMLLQGLPAGWEIAGRIENGKAGGMSWLGELSTPESQPATDDRYAATVALTGQQPGFRLAVRLRAVTPGSFEMPGALLSDMYRPGIFARQATARIKVLPVD